MECRKTVYCNNFRYYKETIKWIEMSNSILNIDYQKIAGLQTCQLILFLFHTISEILLCEML
jgi:hypothetical protein